MKLTNKNHLNMYLRNEYVNHKIVGITRDHISSKENRTNRKQ